MKLPKLLSLFVVSAGLVLMLPAKPAQAADYNNSHLMDDQIFDNVGSMNEAQITAFLAGSDGRLAGGSTCLKSFSTPNFHFDGTNWRYGDINTTNPTDPNYSHRWDLAFGPANITAAQAIYQVSQQWGLNPQVVLATLEKEETLISGTACDAWRYNSAVGYGCPDSGGCNPKYLGFSRQILWGSWQLKFNKERSYGNTAWDGDGDISYVGYMTQGAYRRCNACSTINFDGNAVIDTQTIHLDNGTTASLYTYTPHLGQAFPGIFERWFGSTRVPTYSWQYINQTSDMNLAALPAGQKATLSVVAKNTGTVAWGNSGANPTRLGTFSPTDRASAFSTPSWTSSVRAATLTESTVAPGQNGTFTFTIQAPAATGSYKEYFDGVVEGASWLNDLGLNFSITVVPATISDIITSSTLPDTIAADAAAPVIIKIHNTGNVTWYKDGKFPVRLGTLNPGDRQSPFCTVGWLSCSRPVDMTESSVDPGLDATFAFTIKGPHTPANYTESYGALAEGYGWSNVPATKSINDQGQFVAISSDSPTVGTTSGEKTTATLSFVNGGTSTWQRDDPISPVVLGTASPQGRISQFCDPAWASCSQPTKLNEASVAPGATGTFTFPLDAKTGVWGAYREPFLPMANGQEWFGNPATVTINVAARIYSWQVVSQRYSTNSTVAVAGTSETLTVVAKNSGNFTWSKSEPNPVVLATSHGADRASAFYDSSWVSSVRPAALQEASVAPGSTGTFTFVVNVPNRAGQYTEFYNLVAEGASWFNDQWLNFSFNVVAQVYSWQIVSQGYNPSSTSIARGGTTTLTLVARNTGNINWQNTGPNPVHLANAHPGDRASVFYDTSWLSSSRPSGLQENTVAPGSAGTFTFTVTAPNTAGQYTEFFTPVAEGYTWFNDLWLNFFINVTP